MKYGSGLNNMPDYTARHGEPPTTPDGGTSPIRSDRRNYDSMDDAQPNYLAWFFVIFLAVTLGSLVATYITFKVTEYHLTRAVNEAAAIAATALQQLQHRSAAHQAQIQQQQRNDRATSPIGVRLQRECSEWTQNHAQTKSSYAEIEKNKRCAYHAHYINTGTVPR